MDTPRKSPNTKIKTQRKKLGLSQQQVANRAGIDIRLYQRFESGERDISRATFRIGLAIVDVLELDAHELFEHRKQEDEGD